MSWGFGSSGSELSDSVDASSSAEGEIKDDDKEEGAKALSFENALNVMAAMVTGLMDFLQITWAQTAKQFTIKFQKRW